VHLFLILEADFDCSSIAISDNISTAIIFSSKEGFINFQLFSTENKLGTILITRVDAALQLGTGSWVNHVSHRFPIWSSATLNQIAFCSLNPEGLYEVLGPFWSRQNIIESIPPRIIVKTEQECVISSISTKSEPDKDSRL
jgi:hypothetical protein